MPRMVRLTAVLMLASVLAGCGVAPFPVAPPRDSNEQAARAAEERPQVRELLASPSAKYLSLCYGNAINTPGDVLAEARDRCPYGGQISKVTDDFFWNGCALFQPTRVTFICVPGEPPPSVYQ